MNQEFALILFQVIVLVLAFSVHESAHAYTAMRLGDPTAYMLGRVTLNPMKHLDPLGSVVLPLIALVYHWPLIGWAKPCPITPRNFKHPRRDDILVSLAGPASNLVMALIALLLLAVLKHAGAGQSVLAAMDVARGGGGEIWDLGALRMFPVVMLLYYGVTINLLLFVFNLIPIPPLDGSHVLRQFLPYEVERIYNRLGGFGLLLIFFFGGGIIFGTFYYPLLATFDRVLMSL
jgi:Zn-dependent protease